jgi:flagellar basal-body rod protein FlgF
MQSPLYVSLSAQLSLQRRLDSIANNIANMSTTGFRADELAFEQLISKDGTQSTSFVSRGDEHISRRPGELVKTGGPFDVAVRGPGWLSIQHGEKIVFTRDGRLKTSETGILTNTSGDPVLDVSGSPLQLDPNGAPPQISADGTLTQGHRRIGAIGLFSLPPDAVLTRLEGAAVASDLDATPELDFNTNGVVQGYLEKSNVDSVKELTRLISLQRTFEAVSTSIQETESAVQDAIRALSGV